MKKLLLIAIALLPSFLSAQIQTDSLKANALKTIVSSIGSFDGVFDNISKKPLIFSSQLWFSSGDTGAVLVAAQSFRYYGVEFIPGPMSTNPNARALYNRVWRINKTTTDSFAAGLFNGVVPPSIANWPAHGNSNFGESYYLAPFVDVNNNGYYNPLIDGDYPCFPGDEALFFMYNDDTLHTNTNSAPLGIEVLGMVYAYKANNFLDSVFFVSYTVRNKKQNLPKFKIAAMTDFDLGNSIDDIVGTFIDQNTILAYNGDANDEGPLGHGTNPPSTGIVVLNGIQTNAFDGLDNDKDGCVDGVRDSNGVCQAINAAANIIESWKLSNSMYFNNTSSAVSGNPSTGVEHVRYMNSKWRMGFPLVIDDPSGFMNNSNGDGFISNGTGIPIDFAYPGNSYDTSGAFAPMAPTNWFESPANLADKRMLAGLGERDTFKIGEETQLKLAIFMARDSSTINSFDAAYVMAKKINQYQEMLPTCSGSRLISVEEDALDDLEIFPNPTQNWLSISVTNTKTKQGEIFSYDGRKVLGFTLDEHGSKALDVSALPAGFYVLRIENQSKRFIISR